MTRAQEHLQNANEVLDPESSKIWWAECQNALGALYSRRVAPDRAENLRTALSYMENAYRAYTELDHRDRMSECLGNLAAVHMDLSAFEDEALSRAEDRLHEALALTDRETNPFLWATCQRNLAAVLSRQSDSAEGSEKIYRHLKHALEVFTPDQYLAEYRETQGYVGHVAFDEGDWKRALEAYERSTDAAEKLLAAAYTEPGRRSQVMQTETQYARAAYCSVQMGNHAAALETVEAGKTRLLARTLALSTSDPEGVPQELMQQLDASRNAIRREEAEMRRPTKFRSSTTAEIGNRLRQARAQLDAIIDEIRTYDPHFLNVRLSADDIVDLAPDGGALISMIVTDREACAYVVNDGASEVTSDHLVRLPLTKPALDAFFEEGQPDNWISYLRSTDSITDREDFRKWKSEMVSLGEWLWNAVAAPLHDRLVQLGVPPEAPVVILSQGGVSLLPLQAAARQVNGEHRYLADDYTLSYAPSAFWRRACLEGAASNRIETPKLLAVVDPRENLNFAHEEGRLVSSHHLESVMLRGNEASHDAVVDEATDATHIHFACHGAYDWEDVMRSHLALAAKETLTLSEVLAGALSLDSTRLVSLSACETGITEYQMSPDEYIGLPAAFTIAGAPGVISTLWKVDDAATCLLMDRFYYEYRDHPPAESLRRSQRWLRSLTVADIERLGPHGSPIAQYQRRMLGEVRPEDRIFDEPFYWAGFVFTGA